MTQKLGPNQQKWIDALKYGDFKQCISELEDRGAYCCLGVACIVLESPDVSVERYTYPNDEGYIAGDQLGDQPGVQRALKIHSPVGLVRLTMTPEQEKALLDDVNTVIDPDAVGLPLPFYTSGFEISLVTLNDTYKLNFEQIAGIVERHPHCFFTDAS